VEGNLRGQGDFSEWAKYGIIKEKREVFLTIAKPRKLTLIDTISTGYTMLNKKLWIIGIPIAVNLYLWLGAQLSLAPFLTRLHDKLVLFASMLETNPIRQEQLVVQLQNGDMRAPFAVLNIIPMVPGYVGQMAASINTQVLYVRGVGGVIAWVVGINFVSLLLSSFFLTMLASTLHDEHISLPVAIQRIGATALALSGAFFVVLVVAGGLIMPVLIMLSLLLAQFTTFMTIVLLWFIVGFWLSLYTGFAVEAIVLDRFSPIPALRRSMQLVHQHFFSAIGLLLLLFLISNGLNVVWAILAASPVGMLIALVGSAYIGSGLAAARLVFYASRAPQISRLDSEQSA
jgi:hypothetical protein